MKKYTEVLRMRETGIRRSSLLDASILHASVTRADFVSIPCGIAGLARTHQLPLRRLEFYSFEWQRTYVQAMSEIPRDAPLPAERGGSWIPPSNF